MARSIGVATAEQVPAWLDTLPIARFHRRVLLAICVAFFFELGDLNTFAYAAPGLTRFWHLAVPQIALITSTSFLGMFLGSAVGGWFSDRIGRRRGLLLAVLWYSGFSLVNALVPPQTGWLMAVRLLTGVGLSAMTVIGITYVSEVFPAAKRGRYQALALALGLFGIPITAVVARLVVPMGPEGWRLVFVFGALGLIFFLVASFNLPESPRWLIGKGRLRELADAVARIERLSGERLDHGAAAPSVASPVRERSLSLRGGGLGELLGRRYGRRTLMLWVLWGFATVGFYGFFSWVPTLLVHHGFTLVSSLNWSLAISVANVPGALIAYPLADRLGRRLSIALVCFGAAVAGTLYGLSATSAMIILFGFCTVLMLQAATALQYAYTPEQYPTAIRNAGTGLAYGIGRLTNVISPFIVSLTLGALGYLWVFVFLALCYLIAAAALLLLGTRTERAALERASLEEPHPATP
jgi:MFS transporter, putative metabolite:H+ symporter